MSKAEFFSSLKGEEVIQLLKDGKVGVIPTDTIYGLVCLASDEQAVARLYELKQREHKPGTVIAANIDQLVELGIHRRYLKAVEQFWPNPLSIIIPSTGLQYIHLGLGGIAFRIPKEGALNSFLTKTGSLLTTSANQPDEKPPDTIQKAKKYFENQVDFYVDGGDLSKNKPSTIIRIVDDAIEIVREGAVKINEAGRIDP